MAYRLETHIQNVRQLLLGKAGTFSEQGKIFGKLHILIISNSDKNTCNYQKMIVLYNYQYLIIKGGIYLSAGLLNGRKKQSSAEN